ncbi:hypothetical protein ACFXPS_41205 [Nocardia sp. NPDC059091]|uniref:hypothetical protein n=1 Tax=unclassified Nocardia TaxID=2637762 RepID=UPI00368C4AD8
MKARLVMICYACTNPTCLDSWQYTSVCPHEQPRLGSFTAADRDVRDHLRKLKADGVIEAPLPGETSLFRWMLPFLLLFELPVALFLFFVVVLVFAR